VTKGLGPGILEAGFRDQSGSARLTPQKTPSRKVVHVSPPRPGLATRAS